MAAFRTGACPWATHLGRAHMKEKITLYDCPASVTIGDMNSLRKYFGYGRYNNNNNNKKMDKIFCLFLNMLILGN